MDGVNFEGEARQEPKPDPISEEVWSNALASWIDGHVRNSPIAGVVEAWNHLQVVLPHLKNLLNQQMKSSK